MPKEKNNSKQASDFWAEIDSTVSHVVGKRVFYQNADNQKCLAFIAASKGAGNDRDEAIGMRIATLFVVDGHSKTTYFVDAPRSSGRVPNSWDTAQGGDVVD